MISSGKYRGMTCWFRSIPIVVFSNSYPNLTSLSSDRYDIVTIGIDLYFPRDEEAIYAFEPTIPFVQIAEVPNLQKKNFPKKNFHFAHLSQTYGRIKMITILLQLLNNHLHCVPIMQILETGYTLDFHKLPVHLQLQLSKI